MARTNDIYELIDHTADTGVRVFGRSMAELFERTAFAMFDIMVDAAGVQPVLEREFACRSDSIEELLVDWLNSVLYVFDTEHIVFSRFRVVLDGSCLEARAYGEHYDPVRHAVTSLVKAATYHRLRVRHTDAGYTATVIFDT